MDGHWLPVLHPVLHPSRFDMGVVRLHPVFQACALGVQNDGLDPQPGLRQGTADKGAGRFHERGPGNTSRLKENDGIRGEELSDRLVLQRVGRC